MDTEIYRKMYDRLFNAATDAIAVLESEGEMTAKVVLMKAQRTVEEMFLYADSEDRNTIEASESKKRIDTELFF